MRLSDIVRGQRTTARCNSRSTYLKPLATVAIVGLLSSVVGAAPAQASAQVTSIEDIREAYQAAWAQSPGDFLAFEHAITQASGHTVQITVPEAGLWNVTAAEAQAAKDLASGRPDGSHSVSSVPTNAFNVWGAWYSYTPPWGDFREFVGNWNYRDDYIGSGNPNNISAIGASIPSCWQWDSDALAAYDFQGNRYYDVYREESSATGSIWGVNDRTSGFRLLSDNGLHSLSFQRISSGCSGEYLSASYFWRHHQDGSGGCSASVGLFGLSVSYSGSSGNNLQKGTGQIHTQ